MPEPPWLEMDGSPQIDRGRGRISATRNLAVLYADLPDALEALLGDGFNFGGVGYAEFPGNPFLKVSGVHQEPFHDDQELKAIDGIQLDIASYESYARLDVTYEPLPDREAPDLEEGEELTVETNTYLSYKVRGSTEYMTLTGQAMHWEGAPTLPVRKEMVSVLRIPLVDHHLVWSRVVDPPFADINDTVGTLNEKTFWGRAPETMLFDNWEADIEFYDTIVQGVTLPGAPVVLRWRMAYLLKEKNIKGFTVRTRTVPDWPVPLPAGWNHSYRETEGVGEWDRLLDSANNPYYPLSDFAVKLFRFVPP